MYRLIILLSLFTPLVLCQSDGNPHVSTKYWSLFICIIHFQLLMILTSLILKLKLYFASRDGIANVDVIYLITIHHVVSVKVK